MTTPLHKIVERKTLIPHRGRRIVVSLEPGDLIGLRHERMRSTYFVSIAAVYDMAVRMHVMDEKRKKKEAKRK